jgi:Zn-dependent protease with chaperone function
MKFTPRQVDPETNVNVTPTHPLKELAILLGGLVGIIVVVYSLLGFLVDVIVPRVSPETEKKLAALFIGMVKESEDVADKTRAVQTLVDHLQKQCVQLPYTFRVHVRDAAIINALAMPGGHIVIFTGLLEKIGSENELAFILAHEMGHYAHRDHLRGFGRSMVFMTVAASLFGADSGVSRIVGQAVGLTEMNFSRDQETWADEFALDTVHCFYGHVAGATDFFRKIPKAQDPGIFGHYFASHPENQRRIDHLESRARLSGFRRQEKKPLDIF